MVASVQVVERRQQWQDDTISAMPWVESRGHPSDGDSYWLATVQPDGRPHVLPVLEVWLDGALYVSAGHFSRGITQRADASCYVISVGRQAPDLVVEGDATPVRDAATLRRVAAEYRARYGWQVSPRDGAFGDGAGVFPFEIYEATPATVIDFDAESPFDANRWCL
jgi:hypothetical protein